MEKTRVKKGEKYWFINSFGDIMDAVDEYLPINNRQYNFGNYFHNLAEAESMAHKLNAVLKGADVIEMPSEEEIQTLETKDIVLAEFLRESYKDLDVIMHGRHAYWKGWIAAIRWLKSKIVK